MRRSTTTLAASAMSALLLVGCTPPPAPTPAPAPAAPSVATSDAPATATAPAPSASVTVVPVTPSGLPTSTATPTRSASGSPADSLEAAFAQPENGGIAAFLTKHPDYLPATVVIGAEVVSGASTGPVELTLKNVPSDTTRLYMAIACTTDRPYKMTLSAADGTAIATSKAESCGYWGGLNGYTTAPLPANTVPTSFSIDVPADTRYSYVLFASKGR